MSQPEIASDPQNVENIKNDAENDQDPNEEMDFFAIVDNIHVPAVILANIFLYLDRKDRMNCKIVCKHWLSVLMTDVYFKKDRHLFLNHCILKEKFEPLSLFITAPYGYNRITVGSDVVFGSDNEECWEFFGDNVNYLDIAEKSTLTTAKYVKMLTSMPYLKVLRVHNDGAIYAGLFGRAMELLAMQKVELNLEELQIECVNCNPIKNEYFDVLPKIIEIAPKLKKIQIESIVEQLVPELQNVMEYYPQVKVFINVKTHSDKCVWLLDSETHKNDNIQLEHLDFSFENCKQETLDLYLTNFPSIKGLSLICKTFPSEVIYDKIDTLSLNMRNITDYSMIECLPNLKNLTFVEIHNCLGVHSPICHLDVTKLKIETGGRFDCAECLKSLMLGFPNLMELNIEYHNITKESLAMILKMMSVYKDLKKLSLIGTHLINSVLKDALDLLPDFFTLSIMELKIEVSEITDEVAQALCQLFFHVKYLSLIISNMRDDLGPLIRIILSKMPSLKHVQFNFERSIYDEELKDIQTALVDAGQNLKSISLPFMPSNDEMSREMFDKMPNLHVITLKKTVVTRVEKDQVHIKKYQEKTKNRPNLVSPPRDEENNILERHDHRNFINSARQSRLLRMRLQSFGGHQNINPRLSKEENRRYLLFLRRHERSYMIKRDLEQ